MIKYTLLLFNLLGVLLFRLFFGSDVNISGNAPTQVDPGQEFTVEFNISKGDISGFAQLKLELTEGLSPMAAVEKSSSDFKVSGQTVRFTWTSLPGDPNLKVSFKVKASQGVGENSISGKFSYLVDNNKSSKEFETINIKVGKETVVSTPPPPPPPPPTPDPEPEPEPELTTLKSSGPIEVSVKRKLPSEVKSGDEFKVEVTITKGDLKGFARFQDVLPEGLSGIAGESMGGSFSFLDQKVKIVWENVPNQESFTITYFVKSNPNSSGSLSIEGIFSYVEADAPKKHNIPPSFITITKPEPTNNVVTNTTPPNNTTTNPPPPPQPPPSPEPPPPSNTANAGSKAVKYRVQLAASRSEPVGQWYFQTKFGIAEKVSLESHEGWNKYTVGNFSVYKEARDHRENVKTKGVYDAFVTAYNQGKRITVQEALMLSSQQWFK